MADPQRLGQVLVNLLLNAGEALDGRGTIHLTGRSDPGWVTLEVADDGPGVPGALRDRLFEPFQTTKPLGTGLGLAVSQRIIEEARGHLTLETSAGEPGARFVIRLPRVAGVEVEVEERA
jgi:signal transduction histidine kinase